MKYTILFTTFIFALASSKANDYSNLSDDTFCEYVGTWVDRAEDLTPGFTWNIDRMCKDGKYVFGTETPGLFCSVLNGYYGNGDSWCNSYASCENGSFPDGPECQSKSGYKLHQVVNCENPDYRLELENDDYIDRISDEETGFCLFEDNTKNGT